MPLRMNDVRRLWLAGAMVALIATPLTTLAVGCSKPDAAPAPLPASSSKPALTSPFDGFSTPAELRARLQGAWVVRDTEYRGSIEAWNIDATKVTIYDAEKHGAPEDVELRIIAPCRMVVVRKSPDSAVLSFVTFVFDGDALHVGLGNGGLRKGDSIVACVDDYILTLASGRCQRWEVPVLGRDWEAIESDCAMARDSEGNPAFVGSGSPEPFEIPMHGALVLDRQMTANVAERAPDFAAAKAKADALASH